MREILFRGKSIIRGEWIYGYLNQHRGNIRYDCDCEPIADGCYYINDWQTKIDTGMYGQDYKVDPSTIGQFTGLTDKNGVKIFEGDIVHVKAHSGSFTGCVTYWLEEEPRFVCKTKHGLHYAICAKFEFEVLGNIYDNPKLLEVNESD